MTEINHKKESYAIIGACFEVYNEWVVAFWSRFIRNAWASNSNTSGFQ
jgi:hypothetical protein